MISMFRNEAKVMRRMLESVAPYIDYWVIQNNGSTDGTDDIVREFFRENPIPGHLYEVEEGWVGFGWNRDHVLRTCQSLDHGCDWILKMDCDEQLAVDDDFDWSVLENTEVQAWNVTCQCGSTVYFRTWLWNAHMTWRFNHDLCHETIYCEDPDIGEQYQAQNLDMKFRHIGSHHEGQSWSTPSKFVSDGLLLEERLIRENSMLTDWYHFWYVGKSYHDGYAGNFMPLGMSQQREFCRRAIYNLREYVNHKVRLAPAPRDEMNYIAMIMMHDCYVFLEDHDSAILCLEQAHEFAPERNDHFVHRAEIYEKLGDWDRMLEMTTCIMQPERVCPWPQYQLFIDRGMYHDYGDRIQKMHAKAQERVAWNLQHRFDNVPLVSEMQGSISKFSINSQRNQRLWVVDNFYDDPDAVREYALSLNFVEDLNWYKGRRTVERYRPRDLRESFESIIGRSIEDWDTGFNGCFQITTAENPQVYHHDTQRLAAMIYLTPDAPISSGTRLHRSRRNGARHVSDGQELLDQAYQGNFYDSTKFDIIDAAGNIYNRLVIMDAQHIHSAGDYFGDNLHNGRLVHLFFFN